MAFPVVLDLPFPRGVFYRCTQGPGDSFSHNSSFTVNALDFGSPDSYSEGVVKNRESLVLAAHDGIAYLHPSRGSRSFGNHVNLALTDTTFTLYAHLDRFLIPSVSEGVFVKKGTPIGIEGGTGFAFGSTHIHFGVQKGDPQKDALESKSIPLNSLRMSKDGSSFTVLTGGECECGLYTGKRYFSDNALSTMWTFDEDRDPGLRIPANIAQQDSVKNGIWLVNNKYAAIQQIWSYQLSFKDYVGYRFDDYEALAITLKSRCEDTNAGYWILKEGETETERQNFPLPVDGKRNWNDGEWHQFILPIQENASGNIGKFRIDVAQRGNRDSRVYDFEVEYIALIRHNPYKSGTSSIVGGVFPLDLIIFEAQAAEIGGGEQLADFTQDGTVGFADFFQFADRFGAVRGGGNYDSRFDLNGDGSIGMDDFFQFADDFGKKSETPNKEIKVTLPGGSTIDMVWIEPGTFTMGSPSVEPGRYDAEGPQHQVTLTKGYYLGKYEITQGQWTAVMGTQPWSSQSNVQANPNNPAVYISWNDVQVFIHQLNQAAGDSLYRLPTEAEWEYACRAGTTTPWSFGDIESQLGEYAWYGENSNYYAHAVGTKLPNPWGLYDMHGNVAEWVQDWYTGYSNSPQVDPQGVSSGSIHPIRGGNNYAPGGDLRSARRPGGDPPFRHETLGGRLLRTK